MKRTEMSNIVVAMYNLMTLRQRDDESLIDYAARFKSAKDVMEANIGGPIVLTKHVNMKIESGEETDQEKMQRQAYQQLLAYMYMRNADRNKYGILFNGLSSQFSLGQDQYPKTILDANNVLSNHQFDAAYIEN
jgi:hypothetical protein